MLGWNTWGFFRTPKRFEFEGSFTCAGAAAPTSPKGVGWTVRRTGTGTFVVTLKVGTLSKQFKSLIVSHVSLQQAAAANDVANLVSVSLGSASAEPTLTIETQSSAGTAADLAAGTVHFTAVFTNAVLAAPASTSA